MLDIVKEYMNNITKSLNYIIDRNMDIDLVETDDKYLETFDFRYLRSGCERYVIFIGTTKFDIDFLLTVEDAKYILEHLEDITYLYFERDMVDSIVGNIQEYFNNDFCKYDFYEDFILDCKTPFTKNEILEFVNRRCLDV